jgi:hypothetical protein
MTEHAEVAGTLQVKHCKADTECNEWLQEHGDAEVVDIKFSSCDQHIDYLIIYRRED